MSYMDELNFWLKDDYFDQKTKEELLAIRNNEAEVEDRFLQGTGIRYRRLTWCDRCGNQPYERIYRS